MRIYELNSNKTPYVLGLISGITFASVGLVDSVVYGLNESVKNAIFSGNRVESTLLVNLDSSFV